MKIHYRGNFGTQILQAFTGISVAIERGHTPELVFNCLDVERERYEDYVKNLFDSSKIRISSQSACQKFQYWHHGVATSSVKYMPMVKQFLKNFQKVADKSDTTFVYVFSHGDSYLDEDIYLNKKLLEYSFLFHDKIYLIGNSETLCTRLHDFFAHDFPSLEYRCNLSLEEQWMNLISASCIYSKPNPFVCSAALYEPSLILKLFNFVDQRYYKFDKNEYLFAFEQKKNNSAIYMLPSLSACHDLNHPLAPNQKYLSSLAINNYFFTKQIHDNYTEFPQTILCSLSALPSDIKTIYAIESSLSQSLELNNVDTAIASIFKYLETFLEENYINSGYSVHHFAHLHKVFLSSTKSVGSEFYPPILEEVGFSLSKHFLFNYFYILNRSSALVGNSFTKYSNELSFFIANGYLIINNFLQDGELNMLRNLFQSNNGSLSKNKSTLMSANLNTSLLIKKLCSSQFLEFLSLMTGYAPEIIKEEVTNNTFMQSVHIKKGFSGNDPQQNFHLDTFYPAFKFWLFPYDVSFDSGPFEYVPGSHLPYKSVYNHLQKGYLSNAYNTDYAISSDHMEGSLRATIQDITRMGLNSRRFNVPANSLVIANVGGFHRRSLSSKTVVRHAIHSSIRPKAIFDPLTYHC